MLGKKWPVPQEKLDGRLDRHDDDLGLIFTESENFKVKITPNIK